jgi:rhombotail lipoprotein
MHSKSFNRSLTLAAAVLMAGCGASAPQSVAPSAANAPAPPPVLTHSLYNKDSGGGLNEGDLQTILSTAIDLQLPARVGVVPLAEPYDPKGKVSITTRHLAARDFAAGLQGSKWYSQVSDVSTDLPNVGGIEGLRVIAARYRVRYLMLFSQRFDDATHLNGWAWTYPTVVGMFMAPGVTVESHGVVQADLLDVRTGTILFTAVEPMHVRSVQWMIGAGRAHREAQGEAAAKAAKVLATRAIKETEALIRFAESLAQEKVKVRVIPSPIQASTP